MTKSNSRKISLLAVDDDPQMLKLVEMYLPANNYQITTAISGRSALEILKKSRFDLILMDMQMPNIDGLEMLDRIKGELNISTPVVMATAHGASEVTQSLIEKGAYDIIQKPFTSNRLILTLRNAYHYKILRDNNVILRKKLEHDSGPK